MGFSCWFWYRVRDWFGAWGVLLLCIVLRYVCCIGDFLGFGDLVVVVVLVYCDVGCVWGYCDLVVVLQIVGVWWIVNTDWLWSVWCLLWVVVYLLCSPVTFVLFYLMFYVGW